MKTLKSLIVVALFCVLSSIVFQACQKQDVKPAQEKAVDQTTDVTARMTALLNQGRKLNATPQEVVKHMEAMDKLTFDETQIFLRVLYERGIADARLKNDVNLIEEVERLHAFKLAMNAESMNQYGKSFFHLETAQLQSIINQTNKQLNGKTVNNGRTAVVIPPLSCAFAGGSIISGASYTTTPVSPLLFTNWMWVDNDTDAFTPCDCQFAYPTIDLAYNKVSGTTTEARAELIRRGTLLRRRITSGVSAGTYLVNGTSGLNAFSSCPDFGNQIRLSR